MVRTCAHRNCKNSDRNNKVVSFHVFPKDALRTQKWLDSSGIKSPTGKVMVLCSEHFDGRVGPTKLNPDPLPFMNVIKNHTLKKRTTSPRIRKKKKPSRKSVANSLLSLAGKTQQNEVNNPWRDIHVEESFGDGPNFGISIALEGSPRPVLVSLPIQNSPSHAATFGYNSPSKVKSCSSGKRKGVFQTKRYPWELKSPSAKRPRLFMYSPYFNSSANDESLGCKALTDDGFHDLQEQSLLEQTYTESNPRNPRRRLDLMSNSASVSASLPIESEVQHSEGACAGPTKGKSIGVQCDSPQEVLSYRRCKQSLSEKDFLYFTGVSKEVFEIIYEVILGGDEMCNNLKYEYSSNTPKKPIKSNFLPRDRFFMTLIRLRRGVPLKDLAYLFNISVPQCSTVFYIWIRLLSLSLQKLQNKMFLTADKQEKGKRQCFKPFKNLRCIIDSFEIRIQKPKHFQHQGNTYSKYKKCNTVKFLVAISTLGSISFISEGFEGSISDRQVVLKSGFLDHLNPHDEIMADRGFNIEADLNDLDVDLIIPPFLGKRKSLTARESMVMKAVAKSRVHVERAICRIKYFRLIRGVVPNTMLPILSDLVFVASVFVNFQKPYF